MGVDPEGLRGVDRLLEGVCLPDLVALLVGVHPPQAEVGAHPLQAEVEVRLLRREVEAHPLQVVVEAHLLRWEVEAHPLKPQAQIKQHGD